MSYAYLAYVCNVCCPVKSVFVVVVVFYHGTIYSENLGSRFNISSFHLIKNQITASNKLIFTRGLNQRSH